MTHNPKQEEGLMSFTPDAKKAAKALNYLWETGTLVGDPALLAILKDKAGITYGKGQTTENSGGLWRLLYTVYEGMDGAFVERLAPYKDKLYQRGGSTAKRSKMKSDGSYEGGLTNDEAFKSLLKEAGKEDPLMNEAQDHYFDAAFFVPALEICAMPQFDFQLPLSLAAVYDFCIQSGPGRRYNDGLALDHLNDWLGDYHPPQGADKVSAEKAKSRYLCQRRDTFLKDIGKGYTAYRTGSMLKMMDEGGDDAWDLRVPLHFVFLREEYTGYPDRNMVLTQADLDAIYVPA